MLLLSAATYFEALADTDQRPSPAGSHTTPTAG